MIDWLIQSNWRKVQWALSSQAARLVFLVPAIGYVVLLSDFFEGIWSFESISETMFNPNEADEKDCDSFNTSSGNWRPRMVYFGLITILIAQLVYFFRCHPITRQNATAAEFSEGEADFLYRANETRPNSEHSHKNDHKLNWLLLELGLRTISEAQRDTGGNFKATASAAIFDKLDQTNLVSANICWLLIAIGSGLLAIPSINVFYVVFTSTISSIA